MHVHIIALEWDKKACKTEHEFRTKHIADTVHIPNIRRFPYPIQLILVQEMNKAENCGEEEELPREIDDAIGCKCLFWRRYQLPCRHIFYQHMLFQILTDEDWEAFAFAWEDCGFEGYETAGPEYAIKEMYEEIGAPARRKLNLREVLDGLHAKYYALEEATAG